MSPSWQVDFYRRPLRDAQGNPLWELLICAPVMDFTYGEFCPQSEANAQWLRQQLQLAHKRAGYWPEGIEVFRPQTLTLIEVACRDLPVSVQPRRDLATLKQWLRQRTAWYPNLDTYIDEPYQPLAIDRPPPAPMPEQLMGDRWRFAAISNTNLLSFQQEPIPILSIPPWLMPVELGLPSTVRMPGVVIDGGRQSMRLVQWLAATQPVTLEYIAGAPNGLILEAGLADRWILATFEDETVAEAGKTFERRKQAAQGLHFLLVQPDDAGVTYTGLWLLQAAG